MQYANVTPWRSHRIETSCFQHPQIILDATCQKYNDIRLEHNLSISFQGHFTYVYSTKDKHYIKSRNLPVLQASTRTHWTDVSVHSMLILWRPETKSAILHKKKGELYLLEDYVSWYFAHSSNNTSIKLTLVSRLVDRAAMFTQGEQLRWHKVRVNSLAKYYYENESCISMISCKLKGVTSTWKEGNLQIHLLLHG